MDVVYLEAPPTPLTQLTKHLSRARSFMSAAAQIKTAVLGTGGQKPGLLAVPSVLPLAPPTAPNWLQFSQ